MLRIPLTWLRSLLVICGIGLVPLASPALAQSAGTVPLALVQQFGPNGVPLAGCLLYTYVAGTVSTLQNSFQDFGLTIPNQDPLSCDQYGRVPMFWLASGLIHLRLTDSTGIVYVDVTMQVLGPSSGSGGGGGGGVDPTTIASTGDIKFRATGEVVTGWVKMSGLTIGNAISGASERANSDTQNLFIYLWTNYTNAHCPVSGGRGSSALADYNANKTIEMPDWRSRTPIGLDNMDNIAAGILQPGNISSGGGDTPTTPAASGGLANSPIAQTNLPALTLPVTIVDPGHTHPVNVNTSSQGGGNPTTGYLAGNGSFQIYNSATNAQTTIWNVPATTGITATVPTGGGNVALPVVSPFMLGTWFMKL